MNLFEFLMILLSLIVGLGLAEILSGFGRFLRNQGLRGFSWTHSAIALTIFLGLLQTFWESWGLREIETWTYPAMLLMLGSPICLFLIGHLLYPDRGSDQSLEDYYFDRAGLLWTLAGLAVVIGVLFRPIAFGMPLLVAENLSTIPTLGVCVLLGFGKSRNLHHFLVPLVLIAVILDTLAISYSIA